MIRGAQLVGIFVLSVFLFVRGVVPAFTRIDTDFPNYFTSARLVAHGTSLEKLYDDEWFQEQIYESGIQQQGKFSPYPPITALVMLPLVSFTPMDAVRIWTLFNIGCLIAEIFLLSRATGKPLEWSSLLILGCGHALANNFRFGQFYLVLAVLITAGFLFWQKGRPYAMGAVFGVAAAVKYFPLLFVILFALRRDWRSVLTVFGAVGLCLVVAIAVLGLPVHEVFLSSVLGKHLTGSIQNPFSPTFQSWNSLSRRMFVLDPVLNPSPFVDAPALFVIFPSLVSLGVIGLFADGYRRANAAFGNTAGSVQFAFLNIAGLLLLPASATYHFLLLVLPVAVLLAASRWRYELVLVAVFYLAIGFLPYGAMARFQDSGLLTILAYPRLILMTGIFVATYFFIAKHPVPEIIPSFRGGEKK